MDIDVAADPGTTRLIVALATLDRDLNSYVVFSARCECS